MEGQAGALAGSSGLVGARAALQIAPHRTTPRGWADEGADQRFGLERGPVEEDEIRRGAWAFGRTLWTVIRPPWTRLSGG